MGGCRSCVQQPEPLGGGSGMRSPGLAGAAAAPWAGLCLALLPLQGWSRLCSELGAALARGFCPALPFPSAWQGDARLGAALAREGL